MALVWDWNDKLGEAVFEQEFDGKVEEFRITIYKGNAMAIFVYNYEKDGKDMYPIHTFFSDKTHAKVMLGIDKKSKDGNLFGDWFGHYVKFTLDKNRKEAKELAELFVKAEWKHGITVELKEF